MIKARLNFVLSVLLAGLGLAAASQAFAVPQPVGIFSDHGDVGEVQRPGLAAFDPNSQGYSVFGAGANMWFAKDQFHFVWKKMTGDFLLRTRAEFVGDGANPHRKLGWIVRSTLDTDSPYVDVAVHGAGLTSMQFRRAKGADTEETVSTVSAPNVIQLSRKGNRYMMSVAQLGDPLQAAEPLELDLGDEVYVGLFVCSHEADIVEQGRFWNTRIVVPAPDDFRPYQDYYGSRLEILDLTTGRREIVHRTPDSMQAPNWTPDGKALIYNRNGRLYRFDLASKSVEPIDTAFATSNNNDHVLSFDGRQLGISHHSADHGDESRIYTLPVEGGVPQLVTNGGPSYLHGWSPDGRWLTFTGERNGEFDIYKIPSSGGDEVRLTTTAGLEDGSEYSPDGRHIYFNSTRTGRMQLWRMRDDGSEQTQLTDDDYNNWFPHISPDGKTILFLTYAEPISPSDHPFYKHVYLRSMPVVGGEPRIVAYLYGGQGTINVPSWSPDSTRVAFVSNSAD